MSGENLGDLNEYLFRQIDRLDQMELGDPGQVTAEVERARAVCQVGQAIIGSGALLLRARHESAVSGDEAPAMLSDGRRG